MNKSFFVRLGLIASFLAVCIALEFSFGFSAVAFPVTVKENTYNYTILLVPLDSRPPCTDYVRDLAAMAGIQVLIPPPEILDNYRQPGNPQAIRDWALQSIERADAAILSVDMLIHGSLLASRNDAGASADAEAAYQLLLQLHDRKPSAKLYAFHIIPRLFIADNPATDKYKQAMAEWSVLQDTVSLFENPLDIAKLNGLEQQIPPEIRQRYRNLYTGNTRLNRQLVQLAENSILTGLVLGQDDSAPFGLGNLERRRIENELAKNPALHSRVFVTRGTDEVALTLLSQVIAGVGSELKVYVHYTESGTAETVMPYMPGTIAKTLAEKMQLTAIVPVNSEEAADFILVVHAGNAHSLAVNLSRQADKIKEWLRTGRSVAVVDLSKDFRADQTLLPYLRKNDTPIYQLLAYAGWNTASNSIGTALTQADMVFHGRAGADKTNLLAREMARVGFIAARLLDDWYYQKVYRPRLNAELVRDGIDPYSLQSSRPLVTKKITHQMDNAYLDLIRAGWRNAVLTPQSPELPPLAFAGWKLHTGLPWDRTFEIFVEAQPEPAALGIR